MITFERYVYSIWSTELRGQVVKMSYFAFQRSRVLISARIPAILRIFVALLSPSRQMPYSALKLCDGRFCPHPFQLIIYLSSLISTLYSFSH
jgi:hypothetical protein